MRAASILFLGDDRSAEEWGVRLVENSIRRLAAAGPMQPSPPWRIEGPHFVYDQGPDLFLGRRGRGPLVLAWDTSLLIDYFDHGESLWMSGALPDANTEYGLELEGLQLVISLWVLRDIQMVLLPATLSDARRQLTRQRRSEREQAFYEFARAVSQVAEDNAPPPSPPLILPNSALDAALACVPAGGDRTLVRQAVHAGAHAFITRDKGVLACAPSIRPFGLVVVSPQDLVELLAASGALFCMLDPQRHLYWPFPDLQRVTHLARALPGLEMHGLQAKIATMEVD